MSELCQAIMNRDLDSVRKILTETPEAVSSFEPGENLPLFEAAQSGSLEILKYIVEYSRASLDEYDQDHRSILHYASESGDIDKCRYLIERCGVSVLEADRSLITPYESVLWRIQSYQQHYQRDAMYLETGNSK